MKRAERMCKIVPKTDKTKTVQCPLHGFITLSPIMHKIVDTPEFKRLHNLRQLGVSYMVYPSANHTRFEHSLGVSHLAKLLITSLQQKQPNLNITDKDVELVQIAGLIHDIGHGPFSHLYDDLLKDPGLPNHEERGIFIFKRMVTEYKLKLSPEDIEKITNMINPPAELQNNFMYQIIANKSCSIDVDKIDYIQRDSYHIGFGTSQKYERLLTMCRVVSYENNLTIAWPIKLQNEIVTLFETRYRLHKQIYCHHAVTACEYLVEDIMQIILPQVKLPFTLLNDSMLLFPINKKVVEIKGALDKRKLPKLIGEKVVVSYSKGDENLKSMEKHNIQIFENKLDNIVRLLNTKKIPNRGWKKSKIGFISGDGENPLKNVIYFDSQEIQDDNTIPFGFKLEKYSSFMTPQNCQEYIYRIYINSTNFRDYKYGKNLWHAIVNKMVK